MKNLYDEVSFLTSKIVTKKYSTSFSLGIRCFKKPIRRPIYAIYGFVRLADEIVDSFHDFNKEQLFKEFKIDVYKALDNTISTNPVLNSFQQTVHTYQIERNWIDLFLESMEMDLTKNTHTVNSYNKYILGSAEVVGLMCLHVFCNGDKTIFDTLKEPAMRLGSAYQKVNFLRDIGEDVHQLGRVYFPEIELSEFNETVKKQLICDIDADFKAGYRGIVNLPKVARFGVFLSYIYYYSLLKKIKRTPAPNLLKTRIRISNKRKYALLLFNTFRYKLTIS